MSRLVAVVLPSEEQQTGDMIAVKATKMLMRASPTLHLGRAALSLPSSHLSEATLRDRLLVIRSIRRSKETGAGTGQGLGSRCRRV
jgi:hypothetical protein